MSGSIKGCRVSPVNAIYASLARRHLMLAAFCGLMGLVARAQVADGFDSRKAQVGRGSGSTASLVQEAPQFLAWTNRTGETVSAACSAITNETVYLLLLSGRTRALPLSIFPENEQLRMKQSLGVAPLPGCIVPAWRLFEGQLASAPDVASTRAALGFLVKQVKKQEGETAVSHAESEYWITRAAGKERAVRLALLAEDAQPGRQRQVSDAQRQGKE